MRTRPVIIASFLLLTLSCGKGIPAVEEGVSQTLAEHRSETLSDIRYNIEFSIPESREERLNGQEAITFTLKQRVPVQLDFREGSASVLTLIINGQESAIDWQKEHILLPKQSLKKGTNTVELTFLAGDRSLNRNDDFLYTLFVPDRARTVFPCFDQPDLKGRFSLTLDIPKDWEAVANGSEIASDSAEDRRRISFRETPPLSTYLFAFAAGCWKKETRNRGGEPVSIYFRETDPQKTAQLDDIFQQIFRSLDWLEDYTGIPRPFEKYDCVIVPGFQFGGMEHPGAILFNDKRMFLGESPTTSEKLSRIELIAHETSHLWFGDAVTMRWFNDVWTKEVFANYFGAKISTPLYPEVNIPLRDFRNFNIPAYAEDRTAGTNAIRQPLPNLSSAGLVYGNIVYDKAPVVMRMLSDLLGEEPFREGIREYLNTFLYANADWNDLIAILDKRTPVDLAKWSRVWVEEKGMPTIRYSLDGNGTLTVTQEDPLGRGLIWPQQLSFGDAAGQEVVSVWSDAPAVSVAAPEGILFPDPSASAYGWFVLDSLTAASALRGLPGIPRPEARLSLLATLYENTLRGTVPAEAFAETLGRTIRTERDPLIAGTAASYLKALSLHGPLAGSRLLEDLLYAVASDPSLTGEIRLTAFRTLMEVFRSEDVLSTLWTVFRDGKGYKGLLLSARDYMTLAYELAVRCPDRYDLIRSIQEARIDNPDLLREFRFIYRAAAPDKSDRDALFASLLEPENRQVEPWASSALSYLNHTLRQAEAVEYLYPALADLQEVQRTGDIFFPKNWCSSLLQGHDSPAASAEVSGYLSDHPDLPALLQGKLLQSADHLLRPEE